MRRREFLTLADRALSDIDAAITALRGRPM